jgi:hypothetical protein
MTADPNGVSTREQRLQEVLAAFYEDLEAGHAPDRQALLTYHPDLAGDLAEFFAVQDQVRRLAEPFRVAGSSGRIVAGGHGPKDPSGTTIRLDDGARCSPALDEDRVIGDYELQEEIARGGMGIVYRAAAEAQSPGGGHGDPGRVQGELR